MLRVNRRKGTALRAAVISRGWKPRASTQEKIAAKRRGYDNRRRRFSRDRYATMGFNALKRLALRFLFAGTLGQKL